MNEGKMGGVEEVAVQAEFVASLATDDVRGAVESVANDRMAERLHVDSDLVGAAGLDADLDESERSIGAGNALQDFDVGDGGANAFAGRAAGGHAGAANEVAADGEADGDVVLGEGAVD